MQELDQRSGLAQMQLDLIEFLAPFYALLAAICAALAVWQGIDRSWDAVASLGGIAVVLALVAVAGYRRRAIHPADEPPEDLSRGNQQRG